MISFKNATPNPIKDSPSTNPPQDPQTTLTSGQTNQP